MEKQEYKSKWDELAREIGAEVPPEIEQREQTVSTTPDPVSAGGPSERESAASQVVLPKKAPVNWDNLAGELGLPPAPPEEKPAAPKAEERPKIRETVRREEPRQRESREEAPPPRRERPRRDETPPRREERPPREQRGEQREKRERPEPRREQRGGRRPPRRPPNREQETHDSDRSEREEVSSREEERAQKQPQKPAPVRDEPPKPAAVSLWHKIFGAPTEPAEKFIDAPEVPYTEEPSDFRDEPRDAGGFADAHADEPMADARDEEFADEGDRPRSSSDTRESSDRQRGGRPRRRRGRGRGRRPESSRGGDEPNRELRESRPRKVEHTSDSEPLEDDEFDDELALDEPIEAQDVDSDDEDGDDDDMVEGGGSRTRSTLQRAIPTWDEAIGFIVDSNMQTRSERRPPSRSGSRDNGGRGRSRGRRRPQ
jgi:hypothetical protein